MKTCWLESFCSTYLIANPKPSFNIRLAVASRTPPGASWELLNAATQHIPLELFTLAEAENFLDLHDIKDSERRQEILDFSGRLPVLMSWLAAPEAATPDPILPTNDIVDRFLRWVKDPTLRQAAVYLTVPRYFNLDLVALLLDKPDPTSAEMEFEWLCRMPSITAKEAGWQYHDVVRRYMLYYQRQKSSQIYRKLHERLAAYYDAQRTNLKLNDKECWTSETWRIYTLEYIYHHIVTAPDKHWLDFLNLFTLALWERRKYALEITELFLIPVIRDELKRVRRIKNRVTFFATYVPFSVA